MRGKREEEDRCDDYDDDEDEDDEIEDEKNDAVLMRRESYTHG